MIIVTGAAGFIGSNIIKGLNALGRYDILAVDNLTNGRKFHNLAGCKIADYLDSETLLKKMAADTLGCRHLDAIFHQGACSDTTEWDGRYMMENNYEYSKQLLHYAMAKKAAFLYASSAAVYGDNTEFDDSDDEQLPMNVYGYSKWQFDQYVQPYLTSSASQIVGFRYFNVYGPGEQHKAGMASVAFHLLGQLHNAGVMRLFQGCDGYADGEQLRDFVHVSDVVKVNLWFFQQPTLRGIFNLGTGAARSFNDVARQLISCFGSGRVDYIPFPDHLKGCYQSYTQANISQLRQVGYCDPFVTLEEGVAQYFHWYQQRYHCVDERERVVCSRDR
jgi:ADP-L-glycero-D-manno-heptose 6-epimerase